MDTDINELDALCELVLGERLSRKQLLRLLSDIKRQGYMEQLNDYRARYGWLRELIMTDSLTRAEKLEAIRGALPESEAAGFDNVIGLLRFKLRRYI